MTAVAAALTAAEQVVSTNHVPHRPSRSPTVGSGCFLVGSKNEIEDCNDPRSNSASVTIDTTTDHKKFTGP